MQMKHENEILAFIYWTHALGLHRFPKLQHMKGDRRLDTQNGERKGFPENVYELVRNIRFSFCQFEQFYY